MLPDWNLKQYTIFHHYLYMHKILQFLLLRLLLFILIYTNITFYINFIILLYLFNRVSDLPYSLPHYHTCTYPKKKSSNSYDEPKKTIVDSFLK